MKKTKLDLLLSAQKAAQSSLALTNNHAIATAKLNAFAADQHDQADYDAWETFFTDERARYVNASLQPAPSSPKE
jgi:hypothetical protein